MKSCQWVRFGFGLFLSSCRGHFSATTLPISACPSRTPMANIAATRRREGKIMICRCKHSCQSQGRSPVLDCPGRPYKPRTPGRSILCKQVIICDVRQGSLGSRQSTHLLPYCMHTNTLAKATLQPATRPECRQIPNSVPTRWIRNPPVLSRHTE